MTTYDLYRDTFKSKGNKGELHQEDLLRLSAENRKRVRFREIMEQKAVLHTHRYSKIDYMCLLQPVNKQYIKIRTELLSPKWRQDCKS